MNEDKLKVLSDQNREILGARLRARREQLEQTQADVEYAACLSDSHLGKIERGVVNFTIDKLTAIVAALNWSLEELFDFDSKPEKPENPSYEKLAPLLSDFNDEQLDALYKMALAFHKALISNNKSSSEKEPD